MSLARQDFAQRISDSMAALSEGSVQDGALTDVEKNRKARVLRNGLAVVLFAILEDFIRARTSEVLKEIGCIGIPFNQLPEKLRNAATINYIDTLKFRMRLEDSDADKLSFLQSEAAIIASSAQSPFQLSAYSFCYSKSNLAADDIRAALSAFQVGNPWGVMTAIASRMNYGSLPLRDAFIEAGERRNNAAHKASAHILLPDLQNFIYQARAIASTYDCLISKCHFLMRSHNSDFLSGAQVNDSDCKLIKIESVGGSWKCFIEGRSKALSVKKDLGLIESEAIAKARSTGSFVIWLDESKRPYKWMD